MTWYQKPACASTTSRIESEPASRMTPASDVAYASSELIICAEARSPPISEYLLFEDQPASTIPYTPIEVMAKTTSTPTLTSAAPSFTGSSSSPKNVVSAPTGTVDRKSTRLNSSHLVISYAVFCLKK